MTLASGLAQAQSVDIGSVDVQSSGPAPTNANGAPPISSDAAIGSKAPPGSAPALAPSQSSLNAFEPGSTISDKVIKDVIPPSSDYNQTAKYTPNFLSTNTNGFLGDSKSGWRGFADGQFNITFDGIPFGDANDPTHHSAAYFPGAFLGRVDIDRGPGAASQVGYATFGGTMSLNSFDLSDKFGGNVQGSYGNFNTFTTSGTVQSGLVDGTRALFQYSHAGTDGAVAYGNVRTDQVLAKVDHQFGAVTMTAFANYGREYYNNVNAITWPQFLLYGKSYGQVNGNPKTQQYVGYNNSVKATDMEYIDLKGDLLGFHIDNKVYTYSYHYPTDQNNGADQTIEGNASVANGGTITSVKVPTLVGGVWKSVSMPIIGVANGDVTGYVKYNNYRAYGDIFNVTRDIEAGAFSGTLRTGFWVENVDNARLQQYIDYTTGLNYTQLGNGLQESFKLALSSRITNFQPYLEYEWRPLDRLSITPGYKFESFTRDHDAAVNQTTLQPMNYEKTYTANLPFLAARYRLTPDMTIYAQASKGFLAPTVSAYYVFNPATDNTIAPQSTTNYQAGAVYKTAKITADADVYQVTANNFPLTTTLATGETTYTNAGTARYQGVEAEGTFAVIDGLALYASGALSDAKYINGQFTGLAVGDAPRYTAAGGLIYDNGMFFGSLLQKFTGDYYGSSGQKASVAGTTDGTLNHIGAYNTTDLVVGIRSDALKRMGFGQKAEFKVGVSNIFDHKNNSEISGDPTGLTSIINTKLAYSFLPGRLIYAALKVDF